MGVKGEVYLSVLRPGVRARVEAVVEETESPSLLWLRLSNHIVGQLEDFLEAGLEELEPLAGGKWASGAPCVARRGPGLQRAVVEKVARWEDGVVRGRLVWVDHGGWDWLPMDRLYAVPDRLRHHPWQAFPVRLAGLSPAQGGRWSEDAVAALRLALALPGQLYVQALKTPAPASPAFAVPTVQLFRRSDSGGEQRSLALDLFIRQRALFRLDKRRPEAVRSFPPPDAEATLLRPPLDVAQRLDASTTSSYATAPEDLDAQDGPELHDPSGPAEEEGEDSDDDDVGVLRAAPNLFR